MSKIEVPDRCDGCYESGSFVYPWGNVDAPIAIVDDKPATNHDGACAMSMDGQTRSKQVIESVFAVLGRDPNEYYWTNAYKCGPRVSYEQERTCLVLFEQEMSDFNTVIALGSNAVNAISGCDLDAEIEKLWHPAYVLRRSGEFDAYVEQWRDVIESGNHTLNKYR